MTDQEVPVEDLPGSAPASVGEEVPTEDLPTDYGSAGQMAKTAIEQGLSGATLGASKIAETKFLGVKPEDIAAREAANPITSTVANIGGTAALLTGTGGLGAIAEPATLTARLGVAALEGAGIGGANQITDDWSQNKPLDAQKIAASSGLGALLGLGGAGIVEGIKAKFFPQSIGDNLIESGSKPPSPPPSPPPDGDGPIIPPGYRSSEVPGQIADGSSQPVNSTEEAIARNEKFAEAGGNLNKPSAPAVIGALNKVNLTDPESGLNYNPRDLGGFGQMQLENVSTADPVGGEWGVGRETSSKFGEAIRGTEAAQKQLASKQLDAAIESLSPGSSPTADSYVGGQTALDALKSTYENNANAEGHIFEGIKNAPPLSGSLASNIVEKMTDIPGLGSKIGQMLEEWNPDDGFLLKKYNTSWGIDKATYSAVKEAIEAAQHEDTPNTLESLWNIRKGLDQNVDMAVKGQAPAEIAQIKAALMNQMMESSGNPGLRQGFKNYAINEGFRSNLERTIGASLKPEVGQLIKEKPATFLKKLFANTATIQNLRNYLPPEEFNTLLANHIKNIQSDFTRDGVFSSNKFGTWLHNNRVNLEMAFQDNPAVLEHIQNLTTVMRYLPDAKSINPSGSGKTFAAMIKNLSLYPPDTIKEIGGHFIGEIREALAERAQNARINSKITNQTMSNEVSQTLQKKSAQFSNKLDKSIHALVSGSASQARKLQ